MRIDLDSYREILDTLTRNKSRSFLTGFGVFWGVFMLVALIGGGQGLKEMLNQNFAGFATNSAMVWSQPTSKAYKGFRKGRYWTMEYKDVERIKSSVPELDVVTPLLFSNGGTAYFGDKKASVGVNGAMPDYQLVIAGDDRGGYARHLREQLPQHANVQMLGTVDDDQRRWLYAHCAALVMPSLYEGFGLPVIEAMQWGKPVICSRMTSLPEIGSRYAFYLPSFEPEAMAQTVRTGIAENDAVRALEEQQYAASFNYSHHLEEYWKIIFKIICPCNK